MAWRSWQFCINKRRGVLQKRRMTRATGGPKITGTVDPKMMINALNSGVYSAEFVPFLSLSGHNQLD
jgi:hypothetical protein